ncbi:hypothetical protein Droror1_Dr00017040 [Drosera rotundifolia]
MFFAFSPMDFAVSPPLHPQSIKHSPFISSHIPLSSTAIHPLSPLSTSKEEKSEIFLLRQTLMKQRVIGETRTFWDTLLNFEHNRSRIFHILDAIDRHCSLPTLEFGECEM